MSSAHVTMHRTTTTTTTTAVLINVGYVKTLPGMLKLLQIILGVVATGIIAHYMRWDNVYEYMVPELFFLLISTTCLITTTLLFMSSLCSISTSAILPKTLFESMYHVVATLLYLAAGLCLLIYLNKDENKRYVYNYEPKVAAAAMGLTNCALYLIASLYSLKSYRRG